MKMKFSVLQILKVQLQRILLVLFCSILFSGSGFGQNETDIKKLMIMGHAHMDPVYRWRWNEIESREIYSTFSGVLNSLDNYPELKFVQSYLLYYETIHKHFPDLFEEVKQKIDQKRWSVVGGQWVEPGETMPSGESLIRQFLIAHDFYTKYLGIDEVDIAWSPDVFTGHPVTLPKIYAGCGITNYVFSREPPEGKRIFWWESKDGSRMLGYKNPGHYIPDYKKLFNEINEWIEITNYTTPVLTIGKGDHGGGPGPNDMRNLNNFSNQYSIEIEHTTPENYFEQLNNSGQTWPVQKEEFGYESNTGRWKGCYSSQAKIKKLNRFHENQLLAAEKFLTIGTMFKGKPFYPREDFMNAWKILLFNQFHDIIPGTLTGLAANDVFRDYDKLEQISAELLNAGLENIGSRINTEVEGIPVVVYNPHSWQVTQYVDVEIQFVKPTVEFEIKDSNDKTISYALLKSSEDNRRHVVSLKAVSVPALGYKVFVADEGETQKTASDLKIKDNRIENAHFVVSWNEKGLTSIRSKKKNEEMLKGVANALKLVEDNGSSWSFSLTGKEYKIESLENPEIIYSSPSKAVVKWVDYFQSSKFTRYMTIFSNSEQIDFEMEVDWHSSNKLLRLVFPTNIKDGEAYYDQPYGYVQRKEAVQEYPAQKWIDYSNAESGMALINNGKYGFSINNGTMTMSVVRGARDMDPRMDEGIHSFKYALNVHDADWKAADIPLRAWEFNQPLFAKQEGHHPGPISGWKYSDESFPLEKSFFGIDSDHVIISSLKTKQDAYDPNPVILRVIETEGRTEDVTVRLPYDAISVVECNHLENEIEPRSEIKVGEKEFSFKMGHDQIRTFMVRF